MYIYIQFASACAHVQRVRISVCLRDRVRERCMCACEPARLNTHHTHALTHTYIYTHTHTHIHIHIHIHIHRDTRTGKLTGSTAVAIKHGSIVDARRHPAYNAGEKLRLQHPQKSAVREGERENLRGLSDTTLKNYACTSAPGACMHAVQRRLVCPSAAYSLKPQLQEGVR